MIIKNTYEIELRALLSEEKYRELCTKLPLQIKLINKETQYTTKYRLLDKKGDIRLRHSDNKFEIVYKDDSCTCITRNEVAISLTSKEEIDRFSKVLALLNLKADPPWTNHGQEFEYEFDGYKYNLCLQYIENFAYILEVEFLGNKEEEKIHEQNIREIIKKLGCNPINKEEFSEKIKKYIDENKKN